jgi:hypothetical protein
MAGKARRGLVSSDKRRKQYLSNVPDFGPKERWQHGGMTLQDMKKDGAVARNLEECALDHLLLAGVITEDQKGAGLQLRDDFHRGHVGPRLIARYSPMLVAATGGGGSKEDRPDMVEAAYQRWRLAVRVVGLAGSETVVATACQDKLPPTARYSVLADGLERLAKWYGL